jgi:hypothetical protein
MKERRAATKIACLERCLAEQETRIALANDRPEQARLMIGRLSPTL